MAKKLDNFDSNNEENFKRYQERLAKVSQEKLVPPPEMPPALLISYLCDEGMKLLELEEKAKKVKTPPVKESNDSVKSSKNPYAQARKTLFDKMTDAKRKEIQDMEKSGNTNNKAYKDFLEQVIKLGDSISNNNKKQ